MSQPNLLPSAFGLTIVCFSAPLFAQAPPPHDPAPVAPAPVQADESDTSSSATLPPVDGAPQSDAPARTSSGEQTPATPVEQRAPLAPAPEVAPPSQEVYLSQEPPLPPEKPTFNTLVLVEAIAKYGSVGDSFDDSEVDRDSYGAGLVGGQVTLGILPGGKYFTMAARLSGGAFIGGPSAQSTVGASMMFGANFLRNRDGTSYSYALAGAGVEFLPGVNEDMLAFHMSGGTVVKGISFSGGLDLGGNEKFGFVIFGMQVGWGRLF